MGAERRGFGRRLREEWRQKSRRGGIKDRIKSKRREGHEEDIPREKMKTTERKGEKESKWEIERYREGKRESGENKKWR